MMKSCLLILAVVIGSTLPCTSYGLKAPQTRTLTPKSAVATNKVAKKTSQVFSSSNIQTRGGGSASAKKGENGGGWIGRYIDKLFDSADTNKDGTISITEVYSLVLQMYIQVNRQAPVNPPTREKVEALYATVDIDRNKKLNKSEFHELMMMMYSRTTTRVLAFQFVKLVVAPFFAVTSAQTLANTEFIQDIATDLPEKLQSMNLWTTVLTVLCVSQLGGIALKVADFFLDKIYLEDEK